MSTWSPLCWGRKEVRLLVIVLPSVRIMRFVKEDLLLLLVEDDEVLFEIEVDDEV
jgi:hypothetical protein